MILVHFREGGEGSGNFGHDGRPGQVGGSGSGVSEDIKDIIIKWTAGNQEEIQDGERKNPMSEESKKFNDYLDTLPLFGKSIVYRGAVIDNKNLERYIKEGNIFDYKNSVSATPSKDVALEFSSGDYYGVESDESSVMFRIRQKTAVALTDVPEPFAYQQEVILRKNTRYRVVGVNKDFLGVNYYILVEEL